jgi:hypothetical protein
MKAIKGLFVFVFVLSMGMYLFHSTKTVSAKAEKEWLTPGSEANFTIINVDQAAQTAPNWLQKFSVGIVINGPEKICYPFREGEFHWTPLILQLAGEDWVALETTKEFLNGIEGIPYACSITGSGGTFALFGSYHGPRKPKSVVPTELVCPIGQTLVGDHCQPVASK